MLVVVDANELFSLLIKGNKNSIGILLSNKLQLITPEFVLVEFSKHKDEILSKTHRDEEEFSEVLSVLEDRIKFIPKQDFEEFILEAKELLLEHLKDVPYLALALKFECPIWSQDKFLRKQSKVKVLTTNELLKLLF
jgi:predicted nucleic acid-binding protein